MLNELHCSDETSNLRKKKKQSCKITSQIVYLDDRLTCAVPGKPAAGLSVTSVYYYQPPEAGKDIFFFLKDYKTTTLPQNLNRLKLQL